MAQEPATEKNVLIFRSFTDSTIDYVGPLESALRARAPWPVNFYVESLEGRRLADEVYEKGVAATLEHTYTGQRLDLVMAEWYPALRFVLKHRDELFPSVPVVFVGVDTSWPVGQRSWPGITGVTVTVNVRNTIDLALRLHPDASTVAIITGNSDYDRYWLGVVHAEIVRHQREVREVDLVGLPTNHLLETVAALPPHSLVLFQEDPQGSIQPAKGPYDILAWVGQRLPTYCIFGDSCVNHGGIGGDFVDIGQQLSSSAEIATRVLAGERPEDIPVINAKAHHILVDWRQLRRWNVAESKLPAGTLVLNHPAPLLQRYRSYILAAIAAILVVTLLIIALLWQRARKQKAEAVLHEAEKRFQTMADTTPTLVWMCDAKGKITYINERRLAFTGPAPAAGDGDTWKAYIHPDDMKHAQDELASALESHKTFSVEYRLRRHDGVYRRIFDIACPRVNGDGSFAGFIGSAIDITDQKLAQEALQTVGGRLLEAQEEERRRIARELHDDISQKIALLAVELTQANRSPDKLPPATKERLEEIRQHCSEIAHNVQSLSHQLHNSKLDYLGLVRAIRGFCKEFAQQHDATIQFKDKNVPSTLSKDISLCLFRVTQEALHNALKHSGVKEFAVEVSATTNEIQLVVKDAGVGFDVEEANRNLGLGLVSMQERVRLVQGRFSVESRAGRGTKIIVTLPLTAGVSPTDVRGSKAVSTSGAA